MIDHWYLQKAPSPSQEMAVKAKAHNDQLTKPPGALGNLEHIAITLSMLQNRLHPSAETVAISIFAADHGVVEEGVSAFPQSVTIEMIRNFSSGGAAINVIAQQIGAVFEVVNLGTASTLEALPRVMDCPVGAGTANFCKAPAMSQRDCEKALGIGKNTLLRQGNIDVFIGGEMGIGNTTAATALAAALLSKPVNMLVGRGTGLDDQGLCHKTQVIENALALHQGDFNAIDYLQRLGGFEIAALTGAYIAAAQKGVVVLVDGFICTAAALTAVMINPSIRPWLLFSHQSKEQGHSQLLAELNALPLLDLALCLGEGSGAALAIPLLRMACHLHNNMASFEQANVSQSTF